MSTTHDVTTTDTLRDPGLLPSPDRSTWLVLRILRPYLSWDGPSYATGESAAFHPREAATMIAIGAARRADEPDLGLMPEPEPVTVRALHGFTDPASGACFGAGERLRLHGRTAAALISAGTVALDDGVETPTAKDARLMRARERRQAQGRR